MITLRQSHLEAFRRVVRTDYGDEGALIRALQGQPDPPNWQMQAGTAWHTCLEHPQATDGSDELGIFHRSGGYTFAGRAVEEALQRIGPGVWEVPGRRVFDLGRESVCLTGQADHLYGLVVSDTKTRFSVPDAKDYEDSLQWRVYLLIHQGAWFRYNLFHFRDPREGYCELLDAASVRFWPYVGMEDDVLGWLRRMVEWMRDRKII